MNPDRLIGSHDELESVHDAELLHRLIETIPVMIAVYDPAIETVRVNPEFTRVLGWTNEDIAERDIMQLCYPDPEYRGKVSDFMRSLESGWREFDMVTKDGRVVQGSWANIRLSDDRQVGIGIDVTERNERERALREAKRAAEKASAEAENANWHLRTIFDQAPVVLATMEGPDHVFRVQNDAHRSLVGGRDLVGLPVREALPELEGQGFFELLDRVYRTGEPFVGNQMPARVGRDQAETLEEGYFNFVFQPLLYADGEVRAILSVAVDVTEAVRARQEAQRANRAKSEFLASMSHDFRTPLNAIAGYLDLLDAEIYGPISDEQRQALSRIKKSEEVLLRLVNAVLNFTKLDSGELKPKSERIGVAEVVEEMEAVIRPLAAEEGIDFRIEIDTRAAEVVGDPDRIRQILLNLLGNAVKFTPGGGEIQLACRQTAGETEFRVSDTGSGISEEEVERIFDPFVQLGGRHDGSSAGIGLGLSTSKRLAESMGGKISVESEVGRGSIFILRLPGVA